MEKACIDGERLRSMILKGIDPVGCGPEFDVRVRPEADPVSGANWSVQGDFRGTWGRDRLAAEARLDQIVSDLQLRYELDRGAIG